jgi:hypothetical protein
MASSEVADAAPLREAQKELDYSQSNPARRESI